MPKAYLIDAAEKVIREVNPKVIDVAYLQEQVGGYIELAYHWPTKDTLYVNEEGRLRGFTNVFRVNDSMVPCFFGNGIIVGEEYEDGDACLHRDVKVSYFDLLTGILFANLMDPHRRVYVARML